jgi:hypothetical protein
VVTGDSRPGQPARRHRLILAEALPADDERRTFTVLYTAYFAFSLTDPALAVGPVPCRNSRIGILNGPGDDYALMHHQPRAGPLSCRHGGVTGRTGRITPMVAGWHRAGNGRPARRPMCGRAFYSTGSG